MKRENTRQIKVGSVAVGGGARVSVQSMCNTKTWDVDATVSQILAFEEAGCDIVRVAIPDMRAAQAISAIKERIHIPLVGDIHFDYRLALEAAARGIDKIRINPGNIGGRKTSRRWPRPAANGISPSASASTPAAWSRGCWKNTAIPAPKRLWRARRDILRF